MDSAGISTKDIRGIPRNFSSTNLHAEIRMELTVRVVSNAIIKGHQERVDVFKAFKLGLVNLLDDAVVVWCEVHGFVCELGWKVC